MKSIQSVGMADSANSKNIKTTIVEKDLQPKVKSSDGSGMEHNQTDQLEAL